MTFLRLFLILIIFAIPGMAYPTPVAAQSIKELQTQLENLRNDFHVPGMSIAIVHREGPEWVAGLGMADLASGRAATEETLFRIGSVSKGFVSLAILMLVDEGKLSLEDRIQDLAPEILFSNQWETSEPLRVVHLLENTTGWEDMYFHELAKDSSNLSSLEALEYGQSSRICRWRPGTRMAYCNSGPAVAAYIVEKITGLNFEDFVEQKFFKPLEMQTATYFQPTSESMATLYHHDGITPHDYWNMLYRSVGSINASAIDMANYLLFYLNRGNIYGTQVIPAAMLNRMEAPASTWAAKEGLGIGYGLNNYCTIYDGFVYHGHDGNVPGGLSVIAYMPTEGIGYFYSLNSSNYEAFEKMGACIRAYITRQKERPPIPPLTLLPEKVNTVSGWYEPSSPRMELYAFLERLIGLAYIHFQGNKLFITSLGGSALFLPASDTEFNYVPKNGFPDPVPTLKILARNAEGQFIQISWGMKNPSIFVTMKRISGGLAIFEIIVTGFVLLSLLSILLYAPFCIFGARKPHNREEVRILFWPIVAVLSLLCIAIIGKMIDIDHAIFRLGHLTVWSFSLFIATLVFAASSVASAITLWLTQKAQVGGKIRIYSSIVTLALLISTAYLAYWGLIGLRTWG